MSIAAGGLGAPAAQKFDGEAWMPGQQQYREVTSEHQADRSGLVGHPFVQRHSTLGSNRTPCLEPDGPLQAQLVAAWTPPWQEMYSRAFRQFHEVLMRPTRTSTLTLFVAGVVLFVLSASGQPNQYWESGPSWLGLIGWIGFLICLLLLIVSGLYWVVSRIRHRDRPSPR